MDFPLFHLDFLGNRLLIAIIAVIHVIINHAMAVGAMPLITLIEWQGHRTGDQKWDHLGYRLLAICFIVTTTIGALTGVGIWFSTALVNPGGIGSLIHVFFWWWFFEWIIFVSEICLILAYFLTWKGWGSQNKRRHIGLGVVLSTFSWLTMAVIVAILGFMMDTGNWPEAPSLLRGIMNPIYLPQLLFRTPTAMILAGLFVLFAIYFLTEARSVFRNRAIRFTSLWTLAWMPLLVVGAWWYWHVIPEWMEVNVPVALTTQAFENWHRNVAQIIVIAGAATALIATWGALKPAWLPRVALIIPFVVAAALMGSFERVREFVRKPYVIADYMYSNGIQRDAYPLLQQEGLLAHAIYVSDRTLNSDNHIELGREIFTISCTRCHTTTGVNGIVNKLTGLYGHEPWKHDVVTGFIRNMHNIRTFMPPFAGTDEELGAMDDYLLSLQQNPVAIEGVQSVGAVVPPTDETKDSRGNMMAR